MTPEEALGVLRLLAAAYQPILTKEFTEAFDLLQNLLAECICYTGNPETYEGARAECAVHGAVRAFNQASQELREAREEIKRLKDSMGTIVIVRNQ